MARKSQNPEETVEETSVQAQSEGDAPAEPKAELAEPKAETEAEKVVEEIKAEVEVVKAKVEKAAEEVKVEAEKVTVEAEKVIAEVKTAVADAELKLHHYMLNNPLADGKEVAAIRAKLGL